MNIGLDLDSVLADWMGSMLPHLNEKHRKNLKLADHTDYNMCQFWDCSASAFTKLCDEYLTLPVAKKMKAVPGATKGVKKTSSRS